MEISLKNIGRRFNRDWIFRGINYNFEQGKSYAILGRNGSGKSTLLQLISGSLSPSEGRITAKAKGKLVDDEDLFASLTIAAPYLELIEEFTLSEMIDFHFRFKSYQAGTDKSNLIDLLELNSSKNKALKYFSSGMKQRTKLGLAICTDTPVLLLDEPTSNLDTQAISWYQKLISDFGRNRLVVVCSNQEHEYQFCENHIQLSDYK
ncbi:ATP-binding cassette domain-containing protein [Paradesertivirga mongoliensis]|uniref:ATP-binding cassette domain-containing protein n=1 Tax=Paradesertivirga mongoliensis TaxID=2100740 RepID=A0ABW4ZI97_9SPHI|nr:ATP-binding cassette domain-containing protein [Pedobacter mongoliensis]